MIHVHAKDCMVNGHTPTWGPLGEMAIDWSGQIGALARDGYAGAISLETHWRGDDGNRLDASTHLRAKSARPGRRARADQPALAARDRQSKMRHAPVGARPFTKGSRASAYCARRDVQSRSCSTASRRITGSWSSSRRAAGCSTAWISGSSSSRASRRCASCSAPIRKPRRSSRPSAATPPPR